MSSESASSRSRTLRCISLGLLAILTGQPAVSGGMSQDSFGPLGNEQAVPPTLPKAAGKQDLELPAPRKVTLKLDGVPAPQAIEAFWQATGLPLVCHQSLKDGDILQEDRLMTLDLQEAPYFEALSKFCEAYGEMCFECHGLQVTLFPNAGYLTKRWIHGVLVYDLRSIHEESFTDFERQTSECRIELQVGWEPDLQVLGVGTLTVTEALDDKGRDFLGAKPIAQKADLRLNQEWQGIQCQISLPVAPKGVKTITLKGALVLELPERSTSARLAVKEESQSIQVGRYGIDAKTVFVDGEGVATIMIKAEGGKVSPAEVLDLSLWKSGDGQQLHFPWAWIKPKSKTERADGSVEINVDLGKDPPEALGWTMIEGKRQIRVPFELKDLPLPRK